MGKTLCQFGEFRLGVLEGIDPVAGGQFIERNAPFGAMSSSLTGMISFFSRVAAASSLAMSLDWAAFAENSSTNIWLASSALAVAIRQSWPAPTWASYQASTPSARS
jgi:hypothetical protein